MQDSPGAITQVARVAPSQVTRRRLRFLRAQAVQDFVSRRLVLRRVKHKSASPRHLSFKGPENQGLENGYLL